MRQKISRDANADTTELSTTNQPTKNKPVKKDARDRRVKFEKWLGEVSPELKWGWKYQKYIYKKLAAVDRGECKRLMVFMPPRHGKSELITIRYTAWRLLRDQRLNVILGSYNQKLADKFSRRIKRIVRAATSDSPPSRQRLRLTTRRAFAVLTTTAAICTSPTAFARGSSTRPSGVISSPV